VIFEITEENVVNELFIQHIVIIFFQPNIIYDKLYEHRYNMFI